MQIFKWEQVCIHVFDACLILDTRPSAFRKKSETELLENPSRGLPEDTMKEEKASITFDGSLSWLWIVFLKMICLSQTALGSNLQIECLADLYRASGNDWRGYSLKNLSLTRLGTIDLAIAFPLDWKLQACCQKIQLRFSSENLQTLQPGHASGVNYFLPIAEWTLCSPDLRLLNCYGFIAGDSAETPSVEPSQERSAWSVVLQHCLAPGNKTVGYEASTFGEHLQGREEVQAARYSGNTSLVNFDSLYALNLATSKQISSPCLIEGSLETAEQWFSNIIAISIPQESSISYRFLFHEAEPSNAALFDVLFYSDEDLNRLPKEDKCDSNNEMLDSQWSQTGEESHKILPLSIGNVWSGCSVENINGTPTYTCEGGRNFPKAHTVHIAISNCKKPSDFTLYYFIEISNFGSDCPDSDYPGLSSKGVSTFHHKVLVIWTVVFRTWTSNFIT